MEKVATQRRCPTNHPGKYLDCVIRKGCYGRQPPAQCYHGGMPSLAPYREATNEGAFLISCRIAPVAVSYTHLTLPTKA